MEEEIVESNESPAELQRQLADSIIQMRSLDEIRILLAQGARINASVTQGLRPLHYAVYQKYTECVELFIVRGCKLDLMDDIGYTAVHLAAERGYLTILIMLVEAGARVRFTDQKNLQPVANEPLRLAIKGGHVECAEYLLRSGADANAIYFLGSELHLASTQASSVQFMELLLRFGANTEARDRNGLTPLMRVAKQPNGYEAVKLLLRYGANVNCYAPEQQDYRSALHFAVLSGNLSTLRLLLFAGAWVVYPSEQLNKPSCLDFAILRGDLTMIKLLIEFGAQLNTGSLVIGLPLHVALSDKINRSLEIVQMLLENGANPNLITVDQRGPLLKPPIGEYLNHMSEVQPDVLRLLLKYNARVICTAQVQHPLGILKCLNRVQLAERDHLAMLCGQENDTQEKIDLKHQPLMEILLTACERFSVQAIRRCSLLNETQRRYLLNYAMQPLSLKHLSRLALRKHIFALAEHVFTGNTQGSQLEGRQRSFSTSSSCDDPEEHDERSEDSYVINRNAYKRYVGDRYQNYGPRSNRTLLCEHVQCDPDTCERMRFARSCGLTTDELELLRKRHDRWILPRLTKQNEEDTHVFQLPVGYRIPPGSDWPIRLIQINARYYDYHLKYSTNEDSQNLLNNFLRTFVSDLSEETFKSSASLAIYVMKQLPLPVSLKRYLLYDF